MKIRKAGANGGGVEGIKKPLSTSLFLTGNLQQHIYYESNHMTFVFNKTYPLDN